MIGVRYPDEYAVKETFQLLKIPWEWYDPSKDCDDYEVLIGKKEDFSSKDGNLIDISKDDIFKKVTDLLNCGKPHNSAPLCEKYLNELKNKLKQFTTLVEIPPIPWDYSYIVALTHDVDVTSVRERSWLSIGYAIYNCILDLNFVDGARIFLAKFGLLKDPWNKFEEWIKIESELGVRSTFYFIPFKDIPGIDSPKIIAGKYELDKDLINRLIKDGFEVGVHGIDNWRDQKRAREEFKKLSEFTNLDVGNRTHFLLRNEDTWKILDACGYMYDSTFGYNDDVGFRAGTLQVYKPKEVENLLELPLHIQDGALFMRPCLKLPEDEAKDRCDEIFDFANEFGGVITLLWHQMSLAVPHDWGNFYRYLVRKASKEGAWVTRAVDVVKWFEVRRNVRLDCTEKDNKLRIRLDGFKILGGIPAMRLRIYVDPEKIRGVDGKYIAKGDHVDVMCDKGEIMVALDESF